MNTTLRQSPKNFILFFSLTDEETKINIQLEDGEGNIYNSYIRTASKSRTTPAKLIKWNRDFANFLKTNISIWDEIKKGQSQENMVWSLSKQNKQIITE